MAFKKSTKYYSMKDDGSFGETPMDDDPNVPAKARKARHAFSAEDLKNISEKQYNIAKQKVDENPSEVNIKFMDNTAKQLKKNEQVYLNEEAEKKYKK